MCVTVQMNKRLRRRAGRRLTHIKIPTVHAGRNSPCRSTQLRPPIYHFLSGHRMGQTGFLNETAQYPKTVIARSKTGAQKDQNPPFQGCLRDVRGASPSTSTRFQQNLRDLPVSQNRAPSNIKNQSPENIFSAQPGTASIVMNDIRPPVVKEISPPRRKRWRQVISLILIGSLAIGIIGGRAWWRAREWERLVERLQGKEIELRRIVRGRDWPVPLPSYLREIVDTAWPRDVSVYVQRPGESYWAESLDFDDADLAALCQWTEITFLSFTNPKVTDAGMKAVSRMPRLRELYLYGAEVTDAGLVQIAHVKSLRWLSLQSTKITDKGLLDLKPLKQLETLVLSQTSVTDEGLLSLVELPALKRVQVADTAVTEEGMAEFLKRRPGVIVSRKMPWGAGWPNE